MLSQELKDQVYKLSVSDRLALVSVIIESLQDIPSLQSERSNAIKRMRGLLKTDSSAPTDEEVEAVQIACAVTQGLEAILTRDTQGFASSTIAVLSIRQLLEQLEQTES